ncbi:hypothetical protein G7054_g8476 [Neopestalotiopsis clavispora]|nr:hypothetical protein G7054_g8476 [Neopestalotiopsis clavispora]
MGSYDASKPEGYPPSKTALLLLDYQNALLDMIQDETTKKELVDSAEKLLKAARKNKVAIFHCTMDIGLDPPPTNKTSEAWHTLLKSKLAGKPGSGAECAELAPPTNADTDGGGHEKVSERPPGYRSALVGKGLLATLRNELGVQHLILGGIATSGAVLGTATHATDLDFVVSVVEDACWDPEEEVHRALIDNVIPSLAWVLPVKEAVARLGGTE